MKDVTIDGAHFTSLRGLFCIICKPNFLFYIIFLFSAVNKHKTMSSSSMSMAFSAFSNFFIISLFRFLTILAHMLFATMVAYPINFFAFIIIFFCSLIFFLLFHFYFQDISYLQVSGHTHHICCVNVYTVYCRHLMPFFFDFFLYFIFNFFVLVIQFFANHVHS